MTEFEGSVAVPEDARRPGRELEDREGCGPDRNAT